ncbi:P-loop containing nucleoside triphosphate hydrolase protein [Chytriomyces sp. MP71]|nr:P-loop containing nucleoside triphosphate hydrolase protein [Chytriomyces sp. MP71]
MWITRSRPKPSTNGSVNSTSTGAIAGEKIVVSTIGSLFQGQGWGSSSSLTARRGDGDKVVATTSTNSNSVDAKLLARQHLQQGQLTIPKAPARKALEDLVEEARKLFAERDLKRTVIYSADQYGNWRRTRSRPIRPLSTIVLDGETKTTVLSDAIEFMKNEKWYADRGIPYRRGYMFYGYPGTGKTSFVTALAGELKLNIYVISLANKGLTDETLTELMVDTPPRCILLLEDIDAAFVSRTVTGNTSNGASENTIVTNVTFSGLLNAIDGVAAQEGRILIMTTNHMEKLDPALIRPGRVDVKVLLDKATRAQIQQLFVQFFSAEGADGEARLQALAREFAGRVPEKGVSMAAVQGHLMRFKGDPRGALESVAGFVDAVMG